MIPEIPRRSLAIGLTFLVAGAVGLGCKASELTANAANVAILYDEPVGCERLGEVIGIGGGLGGAYSKPRINQESAENDARNKAAELGATHLLLYPEVIEQGDGRGPDYQDTQPAMAHGSGTGSTVRAPGVAYKCKVAAPDTKSAVAIRSGSAFVEIAAPTSISLAPLGELQSATVFRRMPTSSGSGMEDTETLTLAEPTEVQEVAESLKRAVEDPLKFIPTHRIDLRGELGVQSFLYGFGYVQYAGKEYRLTDGVFENVLQLREAAAEPDVETEPPPADATSGGEALE
jgi:hypothetical protein